MIITEQYSKQNTHKTGTKDWLPVRISLNDLFTSLYADYKRNNGLPLWICMKFENMPDFHLHIIHKIENVVKLKKENVSFWSRPVIQVGPG